MSTESCYIINNLVFSWLAKDEHRIFVEFRLHFQMYHHLVLEFNYKQKKISFKQFIFVGFTTDFRDWGVWYPYIIIIIHTVIL